MQAFREALKGLFTAYWSPLALRAACRLALFDALDTRANTVEGLAQDLDTSPKALLPLLHFLLEADYLKLHNDLFALSEKGRLLTDAHPQSLKEACLLWGAEHLTAWQNLDYTLRTGKPAFEALYGRPFFDYIAAEPVRSHNYHTAMQAYALDDYAELTKRHDFAPYATIADVGGGTGALLRYIAAAQPRSVCILLDMPEVVRLTPMPLLPNMSITGSDFFAPLPFRTDALILSRVLHDWNDEKASLILRRCADALAPNGTLLLIEIMQEAVAAHLLSLNMLVMCESYERTTAEYAALLHTANLGIVAQVALNGLQTILVCKPLV